MTDTIKLLEELITEAVGRLDSLTVDRNGLREQVDTLQERLVALKQEASHGDRESDAAGAWQAEQARALGLVRETLSELRGE